MGKFSAIAAEVDTPQKLPLLHPSTRQPLRDKDGKEAYLMLLSSDSEKARKHTRDTQRRRFGAGRRAAKVSPEEIEAEANELFAILTTDWYLVNPYTLEAFNVEYSHENARELYAERGLAWIREQVDDFVTDRGNFSKASSTS